MVAVLTACAHAPSATVDADQRFSIQSIRSRASPSPLSEVHAGQVRAVFPQAWEVRPIVGIGASPEGVVASPRLDRFERAVGAVQGIEAFWIDVAEVRIPSDYYYLAARSEALSAVAGHRSCRPLQHEVLVDRPPDLTGRTSSPGDYVVQATGTCHRGERATRWAYVVAAPGLGPVREIGLPTSGLYVVVAAVSGPNADRLLKEMLAGARFGGTPLSQILHVAGDAA